MMFILKRLGLKRKSKPYLRYRSNGGKRFWFTSSVYLAARFKTTEDSLYLEAGMKKKGVNYRRVNVNLFHT